MKLAFITFSDIIIREFNGQLSMINLIFIIAGIHRRLMSCNVDWDLKSRSNHYPITTMICLKIDMPTQKQRRCWKNMDAEEVAVRALYL